MSESPRRPSKRKPAKTSGNDAWQQLRRELDGLTQMMNLQLQTVRAIRDSVNNIEQSNANE